MDEAKISTKAPVLRAVLALQAQADEQFRKQVLGEGQVATKMVSHLDCGEIRRQEVDAGTEHPCPGRPDEPAVHRMSAPAGIRRLGADQREVADINGEALGVPGGRGIQNRGGRDTLGNRVGPPSQKNRREQVEGQSNASRSRIVLSKGGNRYQSDQHNCRFFTRPYGCSFSHVDRRVSLNL